MSHCSQKFSVDFLNFFMKTTFKELEEICEQINKELYKEYKTDYVHTSKCFMFIGLSKYLSKIVVLLSYCFMRTTLD